MYPAVWVAGIAAVILLLILGACCYAKLRNAEENEQIHAMVVPWHLTTSKVPCEWSAMRLEQIPK